VQNLGAKAVSAKIMEESRPRVARINIDVVERLAKHAAMRFIVPGDDEWPSELDDLRHAESIQRRGDEPLVDGYALCFAQASEGLPLKFVRAV
jgi:DNA processing protein